MNAQFQLRSLFGLALLLSALARLPERWALRATMLASADDYPRSQGYFDPASADTGRRDVLLKASVQGFWRPTTGVAA